MVSSMRTHEDGIMFASAVMLSTVKLNYITNSAQAPMFAYNVPLAPQLPIQHILLP